jgi:isoleucyl-tRNA synthetase
MFKVLCKPNLSGFKNLTGLNSDVSLFLAWTTTPWTLPSNTALAVGKNIDYVLVETIHPFLFSKVHVILAKELLNKHFPEKNAELKFEDYKANDKAIPFRVIENSKVPILPASNTNNSSHSHNLQMAMLSKLFSVIL